MNYLPQNYLEEIFSNDLEHTGSCEFPYLLKKGIKLLFCRLKKFKKLVRGSAFFA
jgi:hypothetical protein